MPCDLRHPQACLLRLARWIALCAIPLAVMAMSASVQAAQITLRSTAHLTQAGPVTLGDIAALEGDAAIALADTPFAQLAGDDASLTLTRQEVRKLLDERGVNWGRMSLRGYTRCQVTLKPARKETPGDTSPATSPAQAEAVAVANPAVAVAMDSPLTLRDRVMRELVRQSDLPADDLRITFASRDSEALAHVILHERWEIELANASRLGRVLVVARRWEEDRVTRTHRLSADVARRMLAVVAQRDLKRGELLASGDVAIQEVDVTDPHHTPATQLSQVVGQVATQPIGRGQVIHRDDTAKPVLVRRGDQLMVRCLVGGLVIRITARANEAGGLGDVITVTNLDSNERFTARVVGTGQAMLVQPEPARSQAAGKEAQP